MPRHNTRPPSLRRHKASGQAVVTLNGKDHYLGPWPAGQRKPPGAVQQAYDALIAEWLAGGRRLPEEAPALTVNELILAFWRHAEQHYRRPDGTATSELGEYRQSLRPLRELYGRLPAAEFSPLKLKAVRQKMVDAGLSRGVVNRRVGRLVRVYKWGVAEELVPETVHRALRAVPGLQKGRCAARETEPVKPVAEPVVEATLPFLLPEVADLVRVQLLTGMRPGEAVLRPCDIDQSGPVWLYRPARHKTAHHGHARVVPAGPQAQAVLRPYLEAAELEEYLFSPRKAVGAKRARMRQARKTKVQSSQVCRRKPRPKRKPGETWSVQSYARAIARAVVGANLARRCDACKEAESPCDACRPGQLPHWHPHQLRHTKATEIRREAGLDVARTVLGQHSLAVAEIYAEADLKKAAEVMGKLG